MRPHIFLLVVSLTVILVLGVASHALTQDTADGMGSMMHPRDALHLVENSSEQVKRGAEYYDWNCAVCHGDTALGFEEAKLAFPEDHRHCTRCHKQNNPAQKSVMQTQLTPHNAFSIGHPPALRGEGALAAFPNAALLHKFISTTMPRYEPGRLADEKYWDITAFLLELNGALPDNLTLSQENAASVTLHP